jgi:type I restriction enzyme S subunit
MNKGQHHRSQELAQNPEISLRAPGQSVPSKNRRQSVIQTPPGYKQTEVGLIPEDWEVKTAEEICLKIQDGTHFSPSLRGNDYLYVTSKNIGYGLLDVSSAERIDATQHKAIYGRCDVRKGDLLLTKDGANTGNAALNHLEEEFSLLSSVAFLRFDPQRHIPGYYLQQILSSSGQRRIKELMVGNAITRLTLSNIRNLRFPVPPLPEQEAIAEVLSDVDMFITALDQLIAKKRDIKQATMQQLLTGKKRLPGFSGEWQVKIIGEMFEFLNTANNPRSDLSENGEIRYIHYGDIHTKWVSFLDCASDELSLISEDKVQNAPFLEDGDLVMVDASEDYDGIGKSVEVKNATGRRVVAGLHTLLLRGNEDMLADGFKGYLQYIPSFKESLRKVATGISVYGISRNNIKNISIRLPPIPEQRAIAAILSDMDGEIAALEQRRDKTRVLKQGMMQELLTGKTRLI